MLRNPWPARAQQLAALALGDPQRQWQAENVLARCIADEEQLLQLGDASLCHGWAGLVHSLAGYARWLGLSLCEGAGHAQAPSGVCLVAGHCATPSGGLTLRILAAVIVLAATTTISQCGTAPACGVSLRGLTIEKGLVTDVLTVTCNPRPQEHLLQYWLDYKGPGDEYSRRTPRALSEYRIPGPKGFSRTVSAPCVKGYYRTHYTATGTGPDGIPFDFEDTGWPKFFDVDDCDR
ncbi:MAG TPA: hypothetical protein VFQ77_20930 [Pseudonocardiaceae bacterium]|nr:hypothetical protein [Pseudonocardiaceae bacterium]